MCIRDRDNSLTASQCVAKISEVLKLRKIKFEPGSDRVDLAGQEILDDIAKILFNCGDIILEIGGHTDSQGREQMNLNLSQARANAVLFELQRRRILTKNIVAKGYGESEPVASNETEQGREKNRRIEFRHLDPSLGIMIPSENEISILKENTILIGMLNPSKNKNQIDKIINKKIKIFSLELLPRITRAQSMDVLSLSLIHI